MEKDQVETESRDKETKILNLQRILDELQERFDHAERQRQQQARDLDELVSSKDDVGKNVRVNILTFVKIWYLCLCDLTRF